MTKLQKAIRRYQRNLVKDRAKTALWVASHYDDDIGRSMAATSRALKRALDDLNNLLLTDPSL